MAIVVTVWQTMDFRLAFAKGKLGGSVQWTKIESIAAQMPSDIATGQAKVLRAPKGVGYDTCPW